MESSERSIPLTSADISSLWVSYQNETMAICGISHFLQHINDSQIKSILEQAMAISQENKAKLIDIFNTDNIQVPQGFTEQDVYLNAPRLFSDKLYLEYMLNMANLSLTAYVSALSLAERKDVIDFYSDAINAAKKLHIMTKQLTKEKGTYIRAPKIPKPQQIDFVKKQNFLAGWFGDRRPLLGVEIANLVFNARRNGLGQAIIAGFSQVAKFKDVRRFFERGREISGKHLEIFSSILHENYLSDSALILTSEVTDSTIAPYSDKLMTALVTVLNASGIGQYGTAMSASPRHDLGSQYTRLSAEIAHFSDDGTNIMIKNGWLEQPPISANRKDLAKQS